MAELTPPTRWSSTQTRSQFAAIAWLRWRILANGFRRKGATGELIGRIILYTVFTAGTTVMVAAAGIGAYFIVHLGHLNSMFMLFWGIFILCQLLNIQLGQPGTTFDPTQLIRFPLRSNTFVAIRLFFGLLTPANVVGTLMSFAAAIGIGIALPALWLYAFIALAIFAATNVLFSRMVFAWVDRWLATRRAREIFTAFIFAFSLGIQWANFTFNPAYNHGHRNTAHSLSPHHIDLIINLYHRASPLLAALPPELINTSLSAARQSASTEFLTHVLECALYAAFFFTIFALRMRTEFRGENLSDAASSVSRKSIKFTPTRLAPTTLAPAAAIPVAPTTSGASPVLAIMLSKDLLYTRRHMGLLAGFIMPIFFVLIFASKFASRSNSLWIFPAAVAYCLIAVAQFSYNAFGFEAAGAQLYFLAPVRMRDILFAKNLLSFLMALVEMLAIFAIFTYSSATPALNTAIAAMLWATGTLAINNIFGNRRSFTTPKKINPQRMANKPSQVSALISLAVLSVSGGIASGIFFLCIYFHQPWLLIPIFAIFAAVGAFLYTNSLASIDQFALDHREPLFEELCKQT